MSQSEDRILILVKHPMPDKKQTTGKTGIYSPISPCCHTPTRLRPVERHLSFYPKICSQLFIKIEVL